MRRTRLLAVAAVLALVAAVAPVGAQTEVPVTVETTANTRVIHVENMLGAPLTSLDFGSGRSLPFRVRVVDNALLPATFTVEATMTRMYRNGGGVGDYIDSSKVSLGRQVNALSAQDVLAFVQPVLDLTATIDDLAICALLELPLSGPLGSQTCTITANGVLAEVQQLVLDTTGLLSGLPLVPQLNDTGAFTNAEFGVAPATTDPDAATAGAPTALAVAQSSLGDVIATLNDLLDALGLDLADLISDDAIVAAFTAVNALVADLLPGQLGTLVTDTVGAVRDLIEANLLSISGTYLSFPTLDIDTTGAAAGSYAGTLVLTSVQ